MVRVGSLEIAGKIDTSQIEHSLTNTKKKFDSFAGSVKSTFADFTRLGGAVWNVAKGFMRIGAVGLGVMTGLAMKAPALAPVIAKFGIEMFRLSQMIGEDLRPAFDWLLNRFSDFIGFLEQHPKLRKFGEGFLVITGALAGLKGLKWLFGASGLIGLMKALGSATVSASVMSFFGTIATIVSAGAVSFGIVWALMKILDRLVPRPTFKETISDIYSDPLLRTGHTGTWYEPVTSTEMITRGMELQLPSEVQANISAMVSKWLNEKEALYISTNTTGSVGLE